MIYFVFNKTSGTYLEEREDIIKKRSQELFTNDFIISYTKSYNDLYVPDIDPTIIKNNDIIIAVGGDGTVNLCLQFIHDNKLTKKTSLGFIPAGTGNNMVKISNLTKNIHESLNIINKKKLKELQYGTINDKKVFFNFSLGFTSYVLANRKTSTLKGYVLDVIKCYFSFISKKVKIKSENNTINEKLFAAFFINTSHYLSFIKFLKINNKTDSLNVFFLPENNKFKNFIKFILLLIGINFFKTFKSRDLTIELTDGQQIEVDGDIYRSNENILSIKNQNKINFISG